MAVVLIQSIKPYIGLSGDVKPTPPTPSAGSTFYETDTAQTYVYDGSAWQLRTDPGARRVAIGNYNFGDDAGVQGAFTIYTITGDVLLSVFGICDVALTTGGVAPTLELGVSGNTAILIPQIVDARGLILNEIWYDATPTTTVQQLDIPGARDFVIAGGQDAIMTLGGANLTAGDIDFYALWAPLSADGLVVAA